MAQSPVDLALAVGHEVANLLAASRLHAGLWSSDAPADQQRDSSLAIVLLAARAGSLLSLLRPLLAPETLAGSRVTPEAALEALKRGIDPSCESLLRVDLGSAAGLPPLHVASEVLHHLLLCQFYTILELADREEVVRVSARGDAGVVWFELQRSCVDEPPRTLFDEQPAPAGPGLVRACTEAVLAHWGGGISALKEGRVFRVALRLPAARGDEA